MLILHPAAKIGPGQPPNRVIHSPYVFSAIDFRYLAFAAACLLFRQMFTSLFDPHSLMLTKLFWTVFMWTENESWQQHCRVLLLLFSFIQILDVKNRVAGCVLLLTNDLRFCF